MTHEVGSEGQVVIDAEIREQLGIKPGWLALQRVVDGHVEITFVPPPHNGSLKGALARHVTHPIPPEDSWEDAWADAAVEKEQRLLQEWRSERGRE